VGAPEPTLNLVLTNGRWMYAVRRNAPMHYVQRVGLPSDGPSTSDGPGAFRYVLLVSDGDDAPSAYTTVPASSVLVVDRNLDLSTHPL
jgi:hypothetical protein